MIEVGTRVRVIGYSAYRNRNGAVHRIENFYEINRYWVSFDNDSGQFWFYEYELEVINPEPEYETIYSIFSGDVDSGELDSLQTFVDKLPRKSELGDFLEELINLLRDPDNMVTLNRKTKEEK